MNKKKLLLLVGLVVLVALAGCQDTESGTDKADELAADTGQNFENVTVGASYWYESKATENNQYDLVRAQPPFKMDRSLERENLINRFEYLNDGSNVHHVYGVSNDGKVVFYSVAQGKVSSVNSKLTNDKQIIVDDRCLETTYKDDEAGCFKTVESPQMDGSYGSNGNAIFWFTSEGEYMEWNGIYLVSEEPKNIQTVVSLVDIENTDGSGNTTSTNETE